MRAEIARENIKEVLTKNNLRKLIRNSASTIDNAFGNNLVLSSTFLRANQKALN